MFNISDFFKKFKAIDTNNTRKQELILLIIKKHAGIDVVREHLEIRGETLRLKCGPVFRNEIFLKKDRIENDFKNEKIYLKLN